MSSERQRGSEFTGRWPDQPKRQQPKNTCGECRFMAKLIKETSDPMKGELQTICRRRPPVIAYAFIPRDGTSGQILAQSLWPVMMLGDWCGEFEPNADASIAPVV